jgi:hypothetical protein
MSDDTYSSHKAFKDDNLGQKQPVMPKLSDYYQSKTVARRRW